MQEINSLQEWKNIYHIMDDTLVKLCVIEHAPECIKQTVLEEEII